MSTIACSITQLTSPSMQAYHLEYICDIIFLRLDRLWWAIKLSCFFFFFFSTPFCWRIQLSLPSPSYRFVIGREKPGQVSEVAQLISQTLEQERRQRELLEQHYAQYDADDDEVSSARKRPSYLSPQHVLLYKTLFTV